MTQDDTPDSISEFFESLTFDGMEEASCAAHHACRCVVERGRQAARRLAELARENAQLKEKTQKLQRQVNRLCDLVELNALERRLQKAPESAPPEEDEKCAAPPLDELEAAAPFVPDAAPAEEN